MSNVPFSNELKGQGCGLGTASYLGKFRRLLDSITFNAPTSDEPEW
jgi:hypothetical protein